MKTKRNYKTYAGIGARNTPDEVLDVMFDIADELEQLGYILRTGGALGADTAFYDGVIDKSNVELYLPWKGYNGYDAKVIPITEASLDIAKLYHPNWSSCKPAVQKLHARNNNIILGRDVINISPVDFVICYTKNGTGQGGTGQAIGVADGYLIPVFDLGLGINYTMTMLKEWLDANS